MAYDLTFTSATFGTGKFGQGLTGGFGVAPQANPVLPANKTFTVEAWGKTTSNGTVVLMGQNNAFWFGSSSGKAVAHSTSTGGDTTINTTVTVNDGAWHHYALCIDGTAVASGGTGVKFYVDGVLAGSNATVASGSNNSQYDFGVGTFGGVSGYDWVGTVDEAAVWSTLRYPSAFTPPTSAYAGSETGLVALWHLEGNGTNSQGAADTTAPTMNGTVTVSAQNSSGYTASWPAASDNVAVVSYEFDPGTGTYTNIGNVLTYTVAGESPSTTYNGHVRAVDAAGNKATPLAFSATTTAVSGDTTPPTMSGTLAVSAITSSGYTLTWPAASDNVAVTGYQVDDGSGTFVDAGNVLTKAVTGKAASTTYSPRVRAYDAAGNFAAPLTASATTTAAASTLDTSLALFSPGNWNVQAGSASAVNPGASFRTLFTGNSLALNFDMTGVTGSSVPQLIYRVNGTAWVIADIAASVPITIPNGMSPFPHNLLEVVFKSADAAQGRWTTLGAIVKWNGITGGAVLTKPAARPLSGMYFGDSITEGSNAISNGGAVTFNHAAYLTWAFHSAELLGAEPGIVGFGSQGIDVAGGGGVPALTASYPYVYGAVPRAWPTSLDYVVINMGHNDGPGSGKSASCAAILNGILAAVPSTTKIFVLRPFSGNQAASWTAGIAACNAPSRCIYVDTTGWFNTADSYDTVHPNAYAGQTMGELLNTQIRAGLAGAPTLTARTVSVTLGDASGPLANLTGVKVAFYDEATPDLHSVPRYKSSTQTTNASGVLSFVAQSTLASGGTGCLVVQMADGRNLAASVAVA